MNEPVKYISLFSGIGGFELGIGERGICVGFPDNWTKVEMENKKYVSDTQRYKCCGNAVTVNVIREIAKRLLWQE